MSELIDRLRAREGFRLTAQRRAVAEVFDDLHVHLSAEQVHAAARERLPEISLATVYNTLHELVQLGEVNEHRFDGRTRSYDANVAQAHHHLICEACGAVFDLDVPALPAPPPSSEHSGFEVLRTDVTHRGRCARCAVSGNTVD